MPTSPAVSEHDGSRQSAIYRAVMTPINLVSFLISLALIDIRYTAMRTASHQHRSSDGSQHEQASKVPVWLHRVLFRKHSGVGPDGPTTATKGPSPPRRNADQDGTEAYYHSKQRKLMRLEAESAFRIRGVVAVALALLAVPLMVAVLFVVRFVLGVAYHAVSSRMVTRSTTHA